MSRVGKKPIPVPATTQIQYTDQVLTVKGSKGTLTRTIHPDMDLDVGTNTVNVTVRNVNKKSDALQGLTRALVNNMVVGVTDGFERKIEINGIGYRAEVKPEQILFNLGYSHPIEFKLPEGVSASLEKNILKLNCIDKEKLGHTAASIRMLRPPEPYKGKGLKYVEEKILRKAGKTGTK
jgi:large subunit ribosomal protein L6